MVFTGKRNKLYFKLLLLILFGVLSVFQTYAQIRYKLYEDYIKIYSPISVQHMQKYNIPASITLAQGLLESGAGMSDLTKRIVMLMNLLKIILFF